MFIYHNRFKVKMCVFVLFLITSTHIWYNAVQKITKCFFFLFVDVILKRFILWVLVWRQFSVTLFSRNKSASKLYQKLEPALSNSVSKDGQESKLGSNHGPDSHNLSQIIFFLVAASFAVLSVPRQNKSLLKSSNKFSLASKLSWSLH